jgi:hypothetical protein
VHLAGAVERAALVVDEGALIAVAVADLIVVDAALVAEVCSP